MKEVVILREIALDFETEQLKNFQYLSALKYHWYTPEPWLI